MELIRDLLAGFGAIGLLCLVYECVRGWIEAGPPSSHDIRREPWTQDQRDKQREFERMLGK